MFTGKAGRRDCLDYSKETDSLEVEKLFPKDNPLPLLRGTQIPKRKL